MLDSYGFEDSAGLLRCSFCWPRCGIKDYFYSSLGQGRAIQVEISAFKLSNDSIYLRNAGKLMKGFFADIENDGIRKALNDSSWWYEEYASKSIPVCFVLNGMASSVLCLNEYFQITKDAASETLVNFGINGIIEKIHEFDREGYMFYDLQGNVCSPFYERYTISLLEKIIQIKDNVTIRKYIEKWTKYQNETPYPIKALKHPTKRSMGMLAFQFIFFLIASAILYFFIHLFSERR